MARTPAPCGSETAYRRHLRRDEPVDDACQVAHREHVAAKRAAKRAEREALAAAGVDEFLSTHEDSTHSNGTQQDDTHAASFPDEVAEDLPPEGEQSRLEDLRGARAYLRAAIAHQARTDPSKLAPLSKELREVLKEIDQLENDDTTAEADPFEQFFSSGNVARFPTPEDRKAS